MQGTAGQALSSVWMSVSPEGALSSVTPTPPYWPCPSLSLALPRCLFLMSEPGQKPLPRWPSSSVTRGRKYHLIYPEHLLCIRLALGYYVHIITFLPHSNSPRRQLLYAHFTEEEVEAQPSNVKTQVQAGLTHACVSLLLPTCFLHTL